MKALHVLAVLLPAFSSLAAPIEIVEDVITPWPETITLSHRQSIGLSEMTNQERLKRGLALAKPVRLYDQQRDLSKRFTPTPSGTTVGATSWIFDVCCGQITNFSSAPQVTASSHEDAVQQCAVLAVNKPFGVKDLNPTNGNPHNYLCMINGQPVSEGTCTSINIGVYIIQ